MNFKANLMTKRELCLSCMTFYIKMVFFRLCLTNSWFVQICFIYITIITKVKSLIHKILEQVEFELEIENNESRRAIFADNLLQIAAHNIDAQNGRNTWFQAVNEFTYLVIL